jgi:hypothetical protein
MAKIADPGEDEKDSLRRIMAHVLRETSRHAGHADILRDVIDGATELWVRSAPWRHPTTKPTAGLSSSSE